jgi:hypothetical protein
LRPKAWPLSPSAKSGAKPGTSQAQLSSLLSLPIVSPWRHAADLSNGRGNFRVEVPPGSYLVHVQAVDFPRCPEALAAVRGHHYTAVRIDATRGFGECGDQ